MRFLQCALLLLLVIGPLGCRREETPKRPTAAEIQAQIASVQNDPKIPPGVKGMIIGRLQNELASAQRTDKSAR